MPLWFKCLSCGQIYYTANTYRKDKENSCEKCGGKLITAKNKEELEQYEKKYNE